MVREREREEEVAGMRIKRKDTDKHIQEIAIVFLFSRRM